MTPTPPSTGPTTALLTDQYELTMLQAALGSGAAGRRTVFEMFSRRLPGGRRYGVVAGTGRLLEAIADFRFDGPALDHLRDHAIVDDATLDYLASYRFAGDVWGYAEGEVYFAHSPVLVVEGTFAEAVVLETLALSILNHDAAIASAASRMTTAAAGRPCIEMGSRRTHEQAAVAAARAAYVAGFATTSNLEAGRRHGIPTVGTSAHSFTLLHDSEREAFTAQVRSMGPGTTLLVDTYDVAEAVRLGIEIAGPGLGAVRLDSGDLVELAHEVRDQLDAAGARETRILVTSDLDEYAIAALAAAPVDGYGVGTRLVTGSGHPTCGFVYKLVAHQDASGDRSGRWVDVAKTSKDKVSVGGRKYAARRLRDGIATAEVIRVHPPGQDPGPAPDERDLMVPLIHAGEIVGAATLAEARERHRASLAELPGPANRLSKGDQAIPVEWV